MAFMQRNRWGLTLISLALIVCSLFVSPAQAEYNPKTGHFLQRDPNETGALISAALVKNAQSVQLIANMSPTVQYGDGLSLYLYQGGNPLAGVDPEGLWWYDIQDCMVHLVVDRVVAQIEVVVQATILANKAKEAAYEMAEQMALRTVSAAICPPSIYGWGIYDVTRGFYLLAQHGLSWGGVAGIAADLYGLKGVSVAARSVRDTAAACMFPIAGMVKKGDLSFFLKQSKLRLNIAAARRSGSSFLGKYSGGAYGTTARAGSQAHHMPAWQSWQDGGLPKRKGGTPITHYDAPCIQMDPADHMNTASWGTKKGARKYRARQAELIRQGRHKEAFLMDVKDITSKFPGKYDEAIDQAMTHLYTIMR